jgi:hypothetical protein
VIQKISPKQSALGARRAQAVATLLVGILLCLVNRSLVSADITTLTGRVYKNCQVLEVRPDQIRIMHSTGVTSIDFEDLPESVRKRYHYDSLKAAEARQQRQAKERTSAETEAAAMRAAQPQATQQSAIGSRSSLDKQKEQALAPSGAASASGLSGGAFDAIGGSDAQGSRPNVPIAPRRIALAQLWNSNMRGGSDTMRDLQRLFASHANPSAQLTFGAELMLAEGIPYLCPHVVAERHLNVAGKISSRGSIACPGFPRDSIFFHSYDGQFEGRYNRMYIIVDAADQVLSLHLVDESPREEPHMHWEQSWHCYNFVNYRTKSESRLQIAHEIKEIAHDVFRVDSGLLDPGVKGGKRRKPIPSRTLELSRWYVPRPFVELILHCISRV